VRAHQGRAELSAITGQPGGDHAKYRACPARPEYTSHKIRKPTSPPRKPRRRAARPRWSRYPIARAEGRIRHSQIRRHFLFTWLKTHSIDDALIQPYSGHASRTSLEFYSKIALGPAQDTYESVINQFPV